MSYTTILTHVLSNACHPQNCWRSMIVLVVNGNTQLVSLNSARLPSAPKWILHQQGPKTTGTSLAQVADIHLQFRLFTSTMASETVTLPTRTTVKVGKNEKLAPENERYMRAC